MAGWTRRLRSAPAGYYRSRTLASHIDGFEVLRAIEDAAECHAALASFVVFRRGERKQAELLEHDWFESGLAKGQLRVFGPDGSLRCTQAIESASATEVSVRVGESKESKEATLKHDLELELQRVALEALGEARLAKRL
jgi:hypothetical protein